MNIQTTTAINNLNNDVSITGLISSPITFSHSCHKVRFFKFIVDSIRLSNIVDSIPVIIPERLLDDFISIGNIVTIKGQYRSFNQRDSDGKRHLLLHISASEIKPAMACDNLDDNSINLIGYICKTPIYRETPLGRIISDVILSVPRSTGISDYIPCIFWGMNAVFVSLLDVGVNLSLNGRIQSREYTKRLSDGSIEKRTAYEVSVRVFEEVE